MDALTIGYIGFGLLILILFSGIPVGFAMAIVGFGGMVVISGWGAGLGVLRTVPYTTIASYDLSVLALFVLMGTFCFYAGLSQDLYNTVHKWLGHLPGGLAMATVGACAGFAAVSGSSMATAATMGKVALPEMKRYNYDPALATGTIAAGGSIGILIPPSLVLIIYGIITEQSIGKLFLAGFIPGVLEALFYIVTIYILCRRNPSLGPRAPKASFKEMVFSLRATWGVLALFMLVMGGIYLGVFSPTEAGGIGAFGAFIFALSRRRLTGQAFKSSLIDTGRTTAMILIILIGAMILGYFLAVTRLPNELAGLISGLAVNRYITLGGILFSFLLLGAVMDPVAMILITMPVYFPIILALGFDPIWFGIITIRLVEIGLITPPVGLNVYVLKGVAKDVSMGTIFRGIVPFLIADVFHVALLVAVPQISLFLPSLMKY